MMTSDYDQRLRFQKEIDKNFFVIAPAGVGKTTAIVNRILGIASLPEQEAIEKLSKLVVVTYTNKAAQELKKRAFQVIVEKNFSQRILTALQQGFFGTIHSFCLKLIQEFGRIEGISSNLELITNEDATWGSYWEQVAWDKFCGLEKILRYLSLNKIADFIQRASLDFNPSEQLPQFPELDFSTILNCPPNPRSKGSVEKGQKILRMWLEREKQADLFNSIPKFEKGGKDFQKLWLNSFKPLQDWLGEELIYLTDQIQKDFKLYCKQNNLMTYQHQIDFVCDIMVNPSICKSIRKRDYHVILDEAQDTDFKQFQILVEITRALDAKGNFLKNEEDPIDGPRSGRFCAVGDPQQLIYHDRSNLKKYEWIQNRFFKSGGEKLVFSTTHRCAKKIVHAVNNIGRDLLDGRDHQAAFVQMKTSREETGDVFKVSFQATSNDENAAYEKEAEQLAAFLCKITPSDVKAKSWSEIAVLCPRKEWLSLLSDVFQKVGLRVQNHSSPQMLKQTSDFAWLSGLCWIFAHPEDGFEIVGVLREIFGISDNSLARFCDYGRKLFRIDCFADGSGEVPDVLNLLHDLYKNLANKSLRDAVQYICNEIGLNERLNAIEGKPLNSSRPLLKNFLISVSDAERNGLTLSDWVDHFLKSRDDPLPGFSIEPDALQLLTCQKAKGLEWDAVILPFLYREILEKVVYPTLSRDGEARVMWDKFEKISLTKDVIQNNQRLLYVSLTRARNTLILCHDKLFFNEKPNCFGAWLESENFWNATEEFKLHLGERKQLARDSSTSSEKIFSPNWDIVLNQVDKFPKRFLPHELKNRGNEIHLEEDTYPSSDRAIAIDYGLWWHKLCENLPWNESHSVWDKDFEAILQQCSDISRAKREWELLKISPEIKELLGKVQMVKTEVPIFYHKQTNIIEGVIDFIAYDASAKTWHIWDWKTDRVDNPAELKSIYQLQIQAYADGLESLGYSVATAGVYSTFYGVFQNVLN
jgi:ATP-dependent exoDNAse (exonuclease V) beta subunit